jgi:hypothetical protein
MYGAWTVTVVIKINLEIRGQQSLWELNDVFIYNKLFYSRDPLHYAIHFADMLFIISTPVISIETLH